MAKNEFMATCKASEQWQQFFDNPKFSRMKEKQEKSGYYITLCAMLILTKLTMNRKTDVI